VRELRNFVERARALGPTEALAMMTQPTTSSTIETAAVADASAPGPAPALPVHFEGADPSIFEHGYRDHPERHNPASGLKTLRMRKKDRPPVDPFSIDEAETLIGAIHHDSGEAQGNYDEFRFFTGLRPSEQIALLVSDYDPVKGTIAIQARSSNVSISRPTGMSGRSCDVSRGQCMKSSLPQV